jgi:FG-GAP-like repeat
MNAKIVLALALPCALAAQSAIIPTDRRDYTPAGSAFNVATGDFNGDGILDIVSTGNNSPGTVSVLLGKGDGIFAAEPIVSAAGTYYPSALAVGDFNNDGKLDLMVAIELTNAFGVEILLGNGDGTFQAPTVILQLAGSINYLEAIDINHDGNLDVLVADGGLGQVVIALGTGQGTFLIPTELSYGAYFVTGDFNDDGNVDIAIARELYGNELSVLLGKGDGTFHSPIPVTGNGAPFATADLNNDGKLDLVLNFNAETYSVLLGNGNGTFQAPIPVAYKPVSGSESIFPLLVDLNRDGNIDLVIRQQQSITPVTSDCCAVYVLLGNGDGTFGPAHSFEAGAYLSDATDILMVTADFNGDGNPDLALGGGILFGQGVVSVLLGNGQGGFYEQLPRFSYGVAATAPPAASVATGDFNHDGAVDVAAVNPLTNEVAVLLGNGKGALGTAQQYAAGSEPVAVAVADFNHDGDPDLVTANTMGNDVTVMLGNGNGTFQPPMHTAAGMEPVAIAVGDFNHDGRPDVAVANSDSGDVTILLGSGNGTFGTSYSVGVGNGPNAIAVGDFNGDGKLDLAVTNLISQTVSILLGNGNGTFTSRESLAVIAAPYSIAIGDFNHDGKSDLAIAVAYQGTAVAAAVNAVFVALGNGDGTFQAWTQWNVAMGPSHVAVGDFNSDGKPDLVTANYITNDISVLLGNGDGTFQPALNLAADYFASALAVADFTGNGKPDVVVANPANGRLTMMLNPILFGM